MKKIFFLLFIIIFSGCSSLQGRKDYYVLKYQFDKMVSKPIKEKERKSLEKRFVSLKKSIDKDLEISNQDKKIMNDNIDYYIMVLQDLKD